MLNIITRARSPKLLCSLFLARVTFATSILLFGITASAGDHSTCVDDSAGCVAIGEWDIAIAIGAGWRTNPLIDGDDVPALLLPMVSYYGERFFFDTYVAGYTFVEDKAHTLSAVVTIGLEQIYFESRSVGDFSIEPGPGIGDGNSTFDDPSYQLTAEDFDSVNVNAPAAPAGDGRDRPTDINANLDEYLKQEPIVDIDRLHKRRTAGFAGLDYGFYNGDWDFSAQLLTDVTGIHSGEEVRVALSRFYQWRQEFIELSGGFKWQSEQVVDYYYGIRSSEVTSPNLVYSPSDGYSPFIRLDWRRHLFGNWSLQATVHHRWLSSEISASPLVEESAVLSIFVGGVYHF
ncbi:MipA/OmpV family protein [Teredinibacter waterburyi]|uniref:MipA/OmpV family protein n=1 Tax=Teredinibacter waterburyi TaxID=1500538 RepID=UPI00165F97D6|nr:MipA/OmpV family protein [Teredinibacter waterburyi]